MCETQMSVRFANPATIVHKVDLNFQFPETTQRLKASISILRGLARSSLVILGGLVWSHKRRTASSETFLGVLGTTLWGKAAKVMALQAAQSA